MMPIKKKQGYKTTNQKKKKKGNHPKRKIMPNTKEIS